MGFYPLEQEEREQLRESFRLRVVQRCSELGSSIEEAAERIGIPVEKLTGEEAPTYLELKRICAVLFPQTYPSELIGSALPKDFSSNLEIRYHYLGYLDFEAP